LCSKRLEEDEDEQEEVIVRRPSEKTNRGGFLKLWISSRAEKCAIIE